MTVITLPQKSKRFAAEQAAWGLICDVNAIQRLLNDGILFDDIEIQELRKSAYELIALADQATANLRNGSR